jgi:hypothetical protein
VDESVQELLDRQAIVDCVHRYCRGVDRKDEEILLSAFHDDAVDAHGAGPAPIQEFLDFLWRRHEGREIAQHFVTNIRVELDGDIAHGETYFLAVGAAPGSTELSLVGGRYVDRFERRDGEWRIATRVTIPEWSTEGLKNANAVSKVARRDRQDPSYERPLVRTAT